MSIPKNRNEIIIIIELPSSEDNESIHYGVTLGIWLVPIEVCYRYKIDTRVWRVEYEKNVKYFIRIFISTTCWNDHFDK